MPEELRIMSPIKTQPQHRKKDLTHDGIPSF